MLGKLISSRLSLKILSIYAKLRKVSILIVTKDTHIRIQNNGSTIVAPMHCGEVIRGRRASHVLYYYDDYMIDRRVLDEALEPFIIKDRKEE